MSAYPDDDRPQPGDVTDGRVVVDWRDLQHGDRVEVTLTGTVTHHTGAGVRLDVGRGNFGAVGTSVAGAATWRRLPAPLPTEPGTRFWGRTRYLPEQWWFVASSASGHTGDGVDYVSAGGSRLIGVRAAGDGLVRLPDPGQVAP